MKRIIRYLQDQAVQASQQQYSGAAYLSPPTREPQQHGKHVRIPSYDVANHTVHPQTCTESPSSAAHSFPAHACAEAGLANPPNGSSEAFRSTMPRPLNGNITRYQYSQDNILQSYEVYVPELDTSHHSDPNAQRYWVLYIHGGYFRDPAVTSSSFYPALSQLVNTRHRQHRHHHPHLTRLFQQENKVMACIAGYASINYRLSPDDEKAPQDTNQTSRYELRNARWPEQMGDVLAAIAHLQRKFGFGERYLLVGEGVGATMAVLSTLAHNRTFTRKKQDVATGDLLPRIDLPRGVLGVSGIYDFELLHDLVPSYVELTRNAIIGPEDTVPASPARYTAAEYIDTWTNRREKAKTEMVTTIEKKPNPKEKPKPIPRKPRRALILAYSSNDDESDGLVDRKQVEAMENVFRNRWAPKRPTTDGLDEAYVDVDVNLDVDVDVIKVLKMTISTDRHNDIWAQGNELARLIREAVRVLTSLDS